MSPILSPPVTKSRPDIPNAIASITKAKNIGIVASGIASINNLKQGCAFYKLPMDH